MTEVEDTITKGLPIGQCVKKQMECLSRHHPEMSQKQRLAVAYSKCKKGKDFLESDIDDERPPKEWWDSCHATIKKKNPSYTDEQVRKTCGHLWYHQKIKKKIHDFMVEDAFSLKSFMERWRGAHFFAPDLPLHEAATGGKRTSSNVNWIGYDKRKLRVQFKEKVSKKTGKVYPASLYTYDVDPKFHEYMVGAPSKGKFVWNYLRGRIPGRVIDKPWKMTPGGVGGSIVPYSKESPRRIPRREVKRVQKAFAKEIKRGTMLKEMSKVRARKIMKERKPEILTPGQKALIERLERRYKKDFVERVSDAQDLIVTGHYRKVNGKKWIPRHTRMTEPAKKIEKKIEYKGSILQVLNQALRELGWQIQKEKDPEKKKSLMGKKERLVKEIEKRKEKIRKTARKYQWLLKKDLIEEDAIPVEGHYRTINGKRVWIEKYSREGEAKKKILEKVKGLRKTPLPEPDGKKPPKKPKKRGLTPEERRRKEIERQARGFKAPKPLDPREQAIQKLIEQTGIERKEAERQVTKKMGPTPEQVKKFVERKKRERQFIAKNKELVNTIKKLRDINVKAKSKALQNLGYLFLGMLVSLMRGRGIVPAYAKLFSTYFSELKKEKQFTAQQKNKLVSQINQIHAELQALSKKSDLVRKCIKCGKSFTPKHGESRCPSCLKKFMENRYRMGPPVSEKEWYRRDVVREDAITYVSKAVDECAKQRVGERKEEYDKAVKECVKLIGIQRRQAGLRPRSRGTPREERRLERRTGAEERRERIREAVGRRQEQAEARIRELAEQRERRAEVARIRRQNIERRRREREREREREEREQEASLRRYGESQARLQERLAEIRSGERVPPPGMVQVRRGYSYQRGGRTITVPPLYRTPEQAEEQRTFRRRESETAREARRRRRTRRGPKIRWQTRTRLGYDTVNLNTLQKSDLESGQMLRIHAIHPDMNIDVGGADFMVKIDHSTGEMYLYLDYLAVQAQWRGRDATKQLGPQILDFVDRNNLIIRGHAMPIRRGEEVAPSHLTSEERARWRSTNMGDLVRMYESFGAIKKRRAAGGGWIMERMPQPERFRVEARERARASDMIVEDIKKKMEKIPREINIKDFTAIEEVGGYFFYYDVEKDKIYQLHFKGGKKNG